MELTQTLRGERGEGRGQNGRRVLVVAFCSLLSAFCSVSASAEIIDRVLAILPGQIVTLSDVEAALDLGLVEAPAGADRIAGGLRVSRIRERLGSPADMARVLSARGLNDTVVRLFAADDLRLAAYLDERFSSAAQPTDDEIRQAGESARQRLTDERRRTLVEAWTAELRRRADVTVLP
jgi:hypothetical protein